MALRSTSVSVRWALVWLLCLALEAPYRRATGGVYVMYICTLRQMGVLLFKGVILTFLLQKPYQSCAEFLLRTPTYKDSQHHP